MTLGLVPLWRRLDAESFRRVGRNGGHRICSVQWDRYGRAVGSCRVHIGSAAGERGALGFGGPEPVDVGP